MAVYTPIYPDEIEQIVSNYDLGEVLDFESMKGGQANSSYMLQTSAGRFVISICDEKSFEDVEQLAGLLKHLQDQGFATTRVVPDSRGRLMIRHRDKPLFIKQFLEGGVPAKMTPAMLRALGAQIARLHKITPPKGLPDQMALDLDAFETVIRSSADAGYRKWLKAKKTYLAQTLRTDLPTGLIHGDIFYDNTLFASERLVAIIDFEEACHYYTIFDLGMCITGTCATQGLMDLSKASCLIAGYQQVKALSPLEKEQLKCFVVYGAAVTSFWRFRQYNMVFPDSANAKTYEEMNRIADQAQAMPAGLFLDEVF